jgi:hypothetical protein
MNNDMRYFIGKEGFIWWMGVVEDRLDPEQLGRVRVRCFGWHTADKELIPTDALPWAHPVHPNNVPAAYTPKEGDWVVGFFADGTSAQHPVILGVLTGKPKEHPDSAMGFSDPAGVYPKRVNESTLNRLSRGRKDGTIVETRNRNLKKGIKSVGKITWDEPAPTFAPQYPFNFALESESGHALELDDTKGKERVNLAHKNGSFFEMDTNGNIIQKATKDSYSLIMGSDYIYVAGKCNITVIGDCNLKASGKLNVEAKEINLAATGDVKVRAGKKLKLEGKSVDIKATDAAKIGSGKKMNIKGKTTTIQGKSVTLAGKIANKVKTKSGIGKIIPKSKADSPANSGLAIPK